MTENEGLVLAAVDLSEIAPTVLRSGFSAARRRGARLLVLHAVEALTGDEESGPLLPSLKRKVTRVRQEARRSLDRFLAQAGLAGAGDVTAKVDEGAAWRQILRRAHPAEVSLVVLGSPRPGLVLGATAHHVLHQCEVPVLVVRRPPEEGYRKILVGVDFSPASERAWHCAVGLCEEGAEAIACHVTDGDSFLEENGRHALEAKLSNWTRERARGLAVRSRLESGAAREVLLEIARSEAVDLLAVGIRSHGVVADLLPGPLAETIVKEGGIDVLVAGGPRVASR